MRTRSEAASIRVEGPLAVLAAGLLALSLYYVAVYVYLAPYPGLDYDVHWTVISIEEPCAPNSGACSSGTPIVQVGDRLLQIGDLTYTKYQNQRTNVPFAGYQRGDHVPLIMQHDGETRLVDWIYLGPTTGPMLMRLTGTFFVLPYWLSGTAVLLLLRPRDTRWLLLAAFNYLTGLWITIGNFSSWHVASSAFILHGLTLLMVPVYLHLHLLVPTRIRFPQARPVLTLLYGLTVVCLGLDWLYYPLAPEFFSLVLVIAIIASLGMLFSRSVNQESSSTRLATRLMLIGVVLGFGPGMLLWILPTLAGARPPGWLLTAITTAGLPLQPFFYIYALYKPRLGNLEFRANRVLGFYSFVLLFGTAFVIIFLGSSRWTQMTLGGFFFALTVSVIFIGLAIWLYVPYQRLVDRLAYGTEHNPGTIIRTFADQIPLALGRPALSRLLIQEVSPALLIRQSALYLLSGNESTLVYNEGVGVYAERDLAGRLSQLLSQAERYLVPETGPGTQQPFAWVRLAIRIQVGGKTIAAWLLGKRDPDDYYPQPDIELLTTLGNQVGVALETARLFEDLEHRASELETAYRDLQRLDRLKDEFVQNVSHELRTPLTFLRGYLDLLQEQLLGPLTSEQLDAVTTMSDRTEGIIRLVNDIISQQQASTEGMAREPLNLAALVRSCIEAVEVTRRKQAAGQPVHSFCLHAGDDVPPILGDRRRLRQVIDNLLGNAIKFSPDGGTITVDVTSGFYQFGGSLPQAAVTLSVSDEGIGIPASELDQIWQRFYQVDGSSTRRFGGMGLGLAIARGIVEAHGGRIWAESIVGRGSTFRIVLPLHRQGVDRSAETAATA